MIHQFSDTARNMKVLVALELAALAGFSSGQGKSCPELLQARKYPRTYLSYNVVAIQIAIKEIKSNFRSQGFGYGLHGGKPYKFLGSSSKGGQAGTECRRIGGHLPTLGTQEDVDAVQGLRGMVGYTVP